MPSFTLFSQRDRRVACDLIMAAPDQSRFTLADKKRSDAQNDHMWSLFTCILKSPPPWFKLTGTLEQKKLYVHDVMTAAFEGELRLVPNAENDGFVPLAYRTSQFGIPRMADFIEFLLAYCARHGINTDQDSPATETTERPTSLRGVA